MKTAILALIAGFALAWAQPTAFAQQPAAAPPAGHEEPQWILPSGPDPNSQYRLGPDSLPQPGVPKGQIRGPYVIQSKVFPGTQHTFWVYVPAQYDPAKPAALMVFQDGQGFMDPNGDLRAQNVMDNLIYRREIPVMIGVFINPGRRPDQVEPPGHRLGRWHHQPGHRIQHAQRQIRAGDHRGADAGAVQGLQHLQGPRDARHRRLQLRRHRRLRRGLGPTRRLPQGAEQRRQFHQHARRQRLCRLGPERGKKSPCACSWPTAATTTAAGSARPMTPRATGSIRTSRLLNALTKKGYDVNYSWSVDLHGQKYGGVILPAMMRWLWRDAIPVDPSEGDVAERGLLQPTVKN